MAIADQTGKPLSVYIESATPHEVKLVEKTLANRLVDELPEVLIGDKAYDSDELDQKLLDKYGIKLIAPNRKKRNKTQDGRELRRYRKRWKVERLFSWMQNFRHIRIRDDYYPENYLAMIYMAISIIFLRSIVR
ncbi:transposase [Sangeribacter muris]|jgi:transposase|uniref:transposase n=1 Tax=Sangeribacter muris TaxID=2880703 RepID=UPI00244E01D4|nr:transposase [Sangeribacter muris]